MKEETFKTKIHKNKNSYYLIVEKNIRELLGLDERFKKLKKGQKIYAQIVISLIDEEEK